MFELACLFYEVRHGFYKDHDIQKFAYANIELARLAEAAGGNLNLVAQILTGKVQ